MGPEPSVYDLRLVVFGYGSWFTVVLGDIMAYSAVFEDARMYNLD